MTSINNVWRALMPALAGVAVSFSAVASPFRVSIDTSPLLTQPGFMAFDFVAGSPVTGNTATVSAFNTNATLDTSTTSGNSSGSLAPGPMTLGGGAFFSEWLQGVSRFGSSITFDVDFGLASAGVILPDEFSFFLLDANQLPFATSDPTGAGALFYIDLMGGATSPVVYTSSFASVTVAAITGGNVPEPGSLALALLGLAMAVRPASRELRRARRVPAATTG